MDRPWRRPSERYERFDGKNLKYFRRRCSSPDSSNDGNGSVRRRLGSCPYFESTWSRRVIAIGKAQRTRPLSADHYRVGLFAVAFLLFREGEHRGWARTHESDYSGLTDSELETLMPEIPRMDEHRKEEEPEKGTDYEYDDSNVRMVASPMEGLPPLDTPTEQETHKLATQTGDHSGKTSNANEAFVADLQTRKSPHTAEETFSRDSSNEFLRPKSPKQGDRVRELVDGLIPMKVDTGEEGEQGLAQLKKKEQASDATDSAVDNYPLDPAARQHPFLEEFRKKYAELGIHSTSSWETLESTGSTTDVTHEELAGKGDMEANESTLSTEHGTSSQVHDQKPGDNKKGEATSSVTSDDRERAQFV